jgi:predicted transcriptional regulator
MKSVLIELDDDVAASLERVAPARSRQRSEFVRRAIRRALWEIEEQATAEAYRRQPDSAAEAHFDPAVWERVPRTPSRRRSRRAPSPPLRSGSRRVHFISSASVACTA